MQIILVMEHFFIGRKKGIYKRLLEIVADIVGLKVVLVYLVEIMFVNTFFNKAEIFVHTKYERGE